MLEELLTKEEGKTLEFKENTKGLPKIIQTIVAFANTAGGTLVIGIKDKTKEIIGLSNVLEEEERIAQQQPSENTLARSSLSIFIILRICTI